MFKAKCGCEFKIIDEKIKVYDNLPSIDIDFDNIRFDCPITWSQIDTGMTKGVFQLETNLGENWSKKLKPCDIEELSALISIIRPGVLKSILNDKDGKPKNLTQHFVDRKFGLEEVEVIHPCLMPILENTHGILIYQEEALQIAQAIAGFSLQEADTLRKAMGKKLADVMTKVEKQFIDGCKRMEIVSDQQAIDIFGWIRESQRYSFNKCLHPDTLVIKNDGSGIALKNLKIGDKILDHNNKYTKVINIYHSDYKWLYTVTFMDESRTYNITCSAEHKFKTISGEIKPLISIINNRDYVCLQNNKFAKFVSIQNTPIYSKSIDIEVDNQDHLFIANGIVSHNSHGVGYAYLAYWCAYVKAHFPQHFYTAWLSLAHEKTDSDLEMSDLIFDAKINGIDVRRPSYKNIDFTIEKGGCRFGLTNIKGIGESVAKKVLRIASKAEEKLKKEIQDFTWLEFLINMFDINKTAFVNTIYVGALDKYGIPRKQLVYEYQIYTLLSLKEKEAIEKCYMNFTSLRECMRFIYDSKNVQSNRKDIFLDLIEALEKPSYDLKDSIDFIILKETELLSTPLTYSALDKANTSIADTTCKELLDGKKGGIVVIEITDAKEWTIKNGKSAGEKMMFLTGKDDTGKISISVFSEMYKKYKNLLNVNNIIGVYLKTNDKGHMASKIVQA